MKTNIVAKADDEDNDTMAMVVNVGTHSDDNKPQATIRATLTIGAARVLSAICFI